MIVEYSKSFQKAIDKLSGKMLSSVINVVREVKSAKSIKDITDCKKITGYNNVYRIRLGDYRIFFTLYIYFEKEDTVKFEYLISRGQAYNKNILSNF